MTDLEPDFLHSDGEMREVCYKTYDVGSPVGLVTIKMANQLDSVGLTSWEAGFYLAEYFLSHTGALASDMTCVA